jgi:hypothetical protein
MSVLIETKKEMKMNTIKTMQVSLAVKIEDLRIAKYEIKTLRENIKAEKLLVCQVKADAKIATDGARKQRIADKIAKAEVRLAALKAKQNPVGIVAKRQSRKASKVTIIQATA